MPQPIPLLDYVDPTPGHFEYDDQCAVYVHARRPDLGYTGINAAYGYIAKWRAKGFYPDPSRPLTDQIAPGYAIVYPPHTHGTGPDGHVCLVVSVRDVGGNPSMSYVTVAESNWPTGSEEHVGRVISADVLKDLFVIGPTA